MAKICLGPPGSKERLSWTISWCLPSGAQVMNKVTCLKRSPNCVFLNACFPMDNIFLVSKTESIPRAPHSTSCLDAVHGQMMMCRHLPNNQQNGWISRRQSESSASLPADMESEAPDPPKHPCLYGRMVSRHKSSACLHWFYMVPDPTAACDEQILWKWTNHPWKTLERPLESFFP